MTPAKRALVAAIHYSRAIASKWSCRSGLPSYNAARSYAEQEKASLLVREAAREAGFTRPFKLYSEQGPACIQPFMARIRAEAVAQGLL